MEKENKTTTMIIADDHAIIRLGIKLMLKETFKFDIYEANDGNELFELTKKLMPDIVLLDINMPDTDSQGILQNILMIKPDINVLIFSVNKEEIYGRAFLISGARGYLQKDSSPEEIIKAINCVLAGNVYIRKEMQSLYINSKSNDSNSLYSVLSKKELDILHYFAKGDSVTHISRVLSLSASTVSTHKAHIFTKLHINSTQQLMEFVALHPLN